MSHSLFLTFPAEWATPAGVTASGGGRIVGPCLACRPCYTTRDRLKTARAAACAAVDVDKLHAPLQLRVSRGTNHGGTEQGYALHPSTHQWKGKTTEQCSTAHSAGGSGKGQIQFFGGGGSPAGAVPPRPRPRGGAGGSRLAGAGGPVPPSRPYRRMEWATMGGCLAWEEPCLRIGAMGWARPLWRGGRNLSSSHGAGN